jgi:hypothetical protein
VPAPVVPVVPLTRPPASIPSRPSNPPPANGVGGTPSVFVIPPGLSGPAEELFFGLGQIPPRCVPLTAWTSYDLAYACYVRGFYPDALVLCKHGLTLCNDARLHLLKGVVELYLGDCTAAEVTAADYRGALLAQNFYGLAVARERVNDMMRARFDDVVEHQNFFNAPAPAPRETGVAPPAPSTRRQSPRRGYAQIGSAGSRRPLKNQELPMRMPARKTSAPPMTTWKTALPKGVSM